MASLYELTENFLEAQGMLFDEEVEMETVFNTLDCIDCLIEEKADNYIKLFEILFFLSLPYTVLNALLTFYIFSCAL